MQEKIEELEGKINELSKELHEYKISSINGELALFEMLGWGKDDIKKYYDLVKTKPYEQLLASQ